MTFSKKCRAVEIRAVAFRAVDPDSLKAERLQFKTIICLVCAQSKKLQKSKKNTKM